MKITGIHGRLASVLGVAVALGLTAGAASAQQRLAMGATHGNSAFYAYQVAVVSDWNKAGPGVNISVQELGGASASTTALMRGEVDMGIAVTSSDFATMKGKDGGKLRTLYYFAPLPANWVVSADSGINSLTDLAGKQFNPGGRGSATEKQAGSHPAAAGHQCRAASRRRFRRAGRLPEPPHRRLHEGRPAPRWLHSAGACLAAADQAACR
jgi:TRAP-type uncharacterized transport system substrate-binding protein